uniref:RNA helicase n=1 Tax=Salvator merianae TaxID=96440 RepID=A0A8D0DUR6_SALMN
MLDFRFCRRLERRIENPDCFWAYLKGDGNFVDNEMDYKQLQSEMNLFYNKLHRDVDEMKPPVLEEGQVYVVFCEELKSWCRAVIKSIILHADCYYAHCFLVDYAKSFHVQADRIFVALESFMRLPYRAKKIRLYCVKPVTLHVNYYTTYVEAKLHVLQEESFYVYLYVTIEGEKICVNDELIAKNFAYCEINTGIFNIMEDREEKASLCFESLSKEINPALVLWPALLQDKELKTTETCTANLLLQFLNPDPLKALDEQNDIKELLRRNFQGPNHVQSYSWPPIARGCDTIIISSEKDPLLYLLPIITFLQSKSCYTSLPARTGPLAVIVCRGWKKAELVFEILESHSHYSRPLHPVLLLLGMNKNEIKSLAIPRGCEIFITTPHSLLRLLECQSLLFLRLCHLIFDEVDELFSEANDQVSVVLEFCKRNLKIEEKESTPQQIVAVGSHWKKNIEYLMQEFMNDPYIVITSLEEAAIYENVQQVIKLCLDRDRITYLLQTLDYTPANAQKTLIFTSSKEETDTVYKAVESASIFCLKIHSDGSNFDNVAEQWNKRVSSDTHVVLVLTDDCLPTFGIADATHVIHFGFPISPKIFGTRLYSMSANFKSISSQEQKKGRAKSILLLTEKNACHAVGLLNYLERTETSIPPELHDFASGVLEAKEDSKSGRPLCRYLKAYGVCKNKRRCPDRHRFSLEIDFPQKLTDESLPTTGTITILPLYIVDATNYFGRIVRKQKDQFMTLEEEMKEYYRETKNHNAVDTVEKLAVYSLRDENSFHRVQVLEIMQKEENCVHVKFIDEGRSAEVQKSHLLNLPERFLVLPPQAVEFIVCRVKPIDNEVEWSSKITRYINQKIRGKLHEAKIVLFLRNTMWVDPMVRVIRLLDLKASVNEYNIRSEILSTGMGIDNPEHIHELQRLFQDAETTHEKKDLPALYINLIPLKNETVLGSVAASASQSIQDYVTLNSPTTERQASEEQVTSNLKDTEKDDVGINESYSQEDLQNNCGKYTDFSIVFC